MRCRSSALSSLLSLASVGAFACSQGHEFDYVKPSEEGDADTDADADSDADADADGDKDGDGFTVEEGDCDDEDIGVNPARDEDPADGKDNDCDGRLDEQWSGLVAAFQQDGGGSALQVFDTVGRVDQTITLDDDEVVPYAVDAGLNGGWVVTGTPLYINISAGTPSFEYDVATVYEVSPDGTTTALAEFGEDFYDDTMFYWYGPLVQSVRVHPDGWYVAALPGALYRIDTDGTVTELATWAWDINDDTTFELYAIDLAVDIQTGEVGVLDLLGGFATWTEEGGLVQHRKADLSDGWANWDAKIGIGLVAQDEGLGWYAMQGDFAVGSYSLQQFNLGSGQWTTTLEWEESLLRPLAIAADGDHGEFYVSAKGGDHYTLWRLRVDGALVDDFFDEVADGRNLWGLASAY